MLKSLFVLSLVALFSLPSFSQPQSDTHVWPGGAKVAVSLSYDDALNSQLDHAIPALDARQLKASFYILPNSPVMDSRLSEWRQIAKNGHELGNHSVYHPCSASLPGRSWVAKHHDLDTYTVDKMREELRTANTFLKALDGKTERTYTVPCGDLRVAGKTYLSELSELFVAVKGQGVDHGFSTLWAPADVSGEELIEYLQKVPDTVSLVNILFHGVGGDHLSVSAEAHEVLLDFLKANSETYYVDTYLNIMKHVID
jgi:peptidoglycan/xylan/chitin deacetylase (PgdA/CDA1 family)